MLQPIPSKFIQVLLLLTCVGDNALFWPMRCGAAHQRRSQTPPQGDHAKITTQTMPWRGTNVGS